MKSPFAKMNIIAAAVAIIGLHTFISADSWNTGTSGYISSGTSTKVGIGTTGSSAKNRLDVEGAMAVGATYSGTNTAPVNGMIVEGNTGIGIAAPTAKLHSLKTSAHSAYSESAIYGNCTAGSTSGTRACGVAGDASANTGTNVAYTIGVQGSAFGGRTAISGFFWNASGGTHANVNLCAGWGSIPAGSWAATLFGNTYVGGDLTLTGKINIKNWTIEAPDYVFADDYNLRPLSEVEKFISENKHLPEVPSAAEMKKDGVDLAELNMTLLKKVEELTLYVIEQKKEIEGLKQIVQK